MLEPRSDFVFKPLAVDSLLMQAVKHVTKRQPMVTVQALQELSRELNECINIGLQRASPPTLGFRFNAVNLNGELMMQVIDMHGDVVLEWIN